MKVTSLFYKNRETIRTREEWLMRLVQALRPSFELIGHPIQDQVRVTPAAGGSDLRQGRLTAMGRLAKDELTWRWIGNAHE